MDQKEYYLKGIELMKSGDYTKAFHTFTTAISEFPENADFYSERGVVRFHLSDLNGALADMNKAQELEPDKPYRYSSRAFIRDAMKDIKGAIADYKIAIKLDPEDDIAHNNLGLLEEKLGFTKMAESHVKTADRIAKQKSNQRSNYDGVQIGVEGELLLESFKKELNLEVQETAENTQNTSEEENKSVLKIALSVFKSGKARKEYVKFVKKMFRI